MGRLQTTPSRALGLRPSVSQLLRMPWLKTGLLASSVWCASLVGPSAEQVGLPAAWSGWSELSSHSALAAPTRLTAVEKAVVDQADALFAQCGEGDKVYDLLPKAQALWQQVTVTAPVNQAEAFRAVWRTNVLMEMVADVHEAERQQLVALLQAWPELADELAFTLRPQDNRQRVATMLFDLVKAHGEQTVGRLPGLTTAICVVHDQEQATNINENRVNSPSAVDLFGFYAKHARQMRLPMDSTPASLLVFVVDPMVSIQELEWALGKYQRVGQVGKLFFTIDYDYDHYRTGAPKKVTQLGYNLPNIEKFGGVCADQAFFTISVGKAIGVPSVYTTASSGTVGHAWVGYFNARGRNTGWDFNEGRYADYQGLAGRVKDPQTNQGTSDDIVALRAAALAVPKDKRHQALALAMAAATLKEMTKRPLAEGLEPLGAARQQATLDDRLELLQQAVDLSPGCDPAWQQVQQLAADGQLDGNLRKNWAGQLSKLTGRRYPGYAFSILVPMIQSVDDAKEQDGYWNRLYQLVQGRTDLQAYTRLFQGKMWEEAGNPSQAGWCYYEVISKFPNAGPFVMDALANSERMLMASGRSADVVGMYQKAWSMMKPPESTAAGFAAQSNYVKTGRLLAERLAQLGRNAEAQQVAQKLGIAPR